MQNISSLIDDFQSGLLTLEQLASALQSSMRKTMKMLFVQGIAVIDYDFDEDLALAEQI
jgi:predicted HTH domain antitoxin